MMRLRIVKSILWFILGTGTVVGLARFLSGLGATTALTDTTPWGLWIGFDVLGGVALAAGGFVIAGSVYVFHLERYRPILRAAVLTAFLGYIAVAIGLLFDLGLPWHIWHMIIFWNPRSPLFEVGWCVMLYLTVLLLEFSPVVLEKTSFRRLLKWMKQVTLPLVILGIMLSTLHQSSLGSLFLIMPFRIHPLWYSNLLPVLFFVSAVGLGLMMATMEAVISSWLYQKGIEKNLLAGLGKAAAWVLAFYAFLKLGDLAYQQKLGLLLTGSWESVLFVFELLLTAILPAILLAFQHVRTSKGGLTAVAAMVTIGFIMNRIFVSGVATISATGTDYFPSLMEIIISLTVVSGGILTFLFFVENFRVYETEVGTTTVPSPIEAAGTPRGGWLGDPLFGNIRTYSFYYITGAVITFSLLPEEAIHGARSIPMPVERARIGQALFINGNRSDMAVLFDHDTHKKNNGGDESCTLCHHINKPFDMYTPCAECHRDMYMETYIFQHTFHQERLGENTGCIKCHTDLSLPKTLATTTECETCHGQWRAENAIVTLSEETRKNYATGYVDAMHGLCIQCHESKKESVGKPELPQCTTCHRVLPQDIRIALDKLYARTP